jgi:hypothetical protein
LLIAVQFFSHPASFDLRRISGDSPGRGFSTAHGGVVEFLRRGPHLLIQLRFYRRPATTAPQTYNGLVYKSYKMPRHSTPSTVRGSGEMEVVPKQPWYIWRMNLLFLVAECRMLRRRSREPAFLRQLR